MRTRTNKFQEQKMPDKTQDPSRTGEMPVVEPQLDLEREMARPNHLPELPAIDGSTTGVIPIQKLQKEGTDDPTDRDKDTDV